MYTIETSLLSLLCYWAYNGFHLSFNPTVTLYGAVYGALVVVSLIFTTFMYNYGSIAFINFVTSTVSLISAALAGILFFDETITPDKLLRIAMMIVAVFVVMLGARKKMPVADQNSKKKRGIHPFVIIMPTLVAIAGTGASIVLKAYIATDGATDENSLFFMTNVFSFAYTIPILCFIAKREKIGAREIGKIFIDKRGVILILSIAVGGVQSIITALMVARMDVAVYTPIASAIGFVALAIATPLVRERLDRYTLTTTAIALLSLFLPLLIS
jgi:drug/metabolite transporter (DMT)-like permease